MEFKVPELGEGVMEGELVKWRVAVGDTVSHDQPIFEVMTDKATVEVPSPFAGKVTSLHAKEGETVEVNQVVVSYESADGAEASNGSSAASEPTPEPKKEAPAAAAPAPTPTPAASAPVAAAPTPAPVTASASGISARGPGEVRAAPSTRRLAREMGLDIASVAGSGPEGRILQADLEKFQRAGGGATAAGFARPTRTFTQGGEERTPLRGLRRMISERMRESKDKAAHFTYVEEADATELVKLRKSAKELGAQQGIKVTFLPFVMKAMVAACRQYPILNSHLDEETNEIVTKHYFNIGLSVQTDDGLMAPVVKNVEQKSIFEISQEIQDLVEKARNKKLGREDLVGSTITLTNAGSIGGLFATPVINFPEVAIVGFNKIFRKPVVKTVGGREKIVVRDWTYFSISLDHRIVDGAIAAEYMKVMIQYLENPSLLFLDSF